MKVGPHDSDNDNNRNHRHDENDHRHRHISHKDRDRHHSSRHDKEKDKDRVDDRGHHRSSRKYHHSSSDHSSHSKDKSRGHRHHYHRSSSKTKDDGRDRDRDREGHKASKHKHRDDMIVEDVEDGDDENSDVDIRKDRRLYRSKQSRISSPGARLNVDTAAANQASGPAAVETAVESDSNKISHMMSPSTPTASPRGRTIGGLLNKKQGQGPGSQQGQRAEDYDSNRLNMFFREASRKDILFDYLPSEEDQILESISEILFKPYPMQLKVFSAFIWFSQFLTLISLFYSLLPCPDEKPSWLVFIGVPLCCVYAGIECIHHMLRYIHLGRGYRLLVCLMNINCVMQLLCVGVVMGKSEDLLNLISNFIGVAIVLQIDEFLASYIRIKDIDPDLLEKKSWRTKMMLKSKMWLIILAGLIVYAVTLACWRVDSMYCSSYQFEDNIDGVDSVTNAT